MLAQMVSALVGAARLLRVILAACTLGVVGPADVALGDENESADRPRQHAAIAAGTFHTCALGADGSVRCWGDDSVGQLGDGGPIPGPDASAPATTVALGQAARAITAGSSHTCALLADGSVRCWGFDSAGQLGDGAPNANTSMPSTAVVLGQATRAITAGNGHTCALLADGSVRCWGRDSSGQLGDGGPIPGTDANAPATAVALGQAARAIMAGGDFTCALLADGSVRCWGLDTLGQLGDGAPNANTSAPSVPVALGQAARAIAAGTNHTCALLADGIVRCWGSDNFGQLGDGGPIPGTDASTPSIAVALGPAAHAITGGGVFTCALLTDGSVRCWGVDSSGQLGDGGPIPGTNTSAPSTAVAFGQGARAITAGGLHVCALLVDGTLRCWGGDGDGQLGDGPPAANSSVPAAAVELPAFGSVDSADLSLTAQVSSASAAAEDAVTITLTLANAGVDPASTTVTVLLSERLTLVVSTPAQGTYSAATGLWNINPIAPAAATTLTLTAEAASPGSALTTAEVTDSSAQDPDSTPGNHDPGEDDRASAVVTVPCASACTTVDPCHPQACIEEECLARDLTGPARASCACQRPTPVPCAGTAPPSKVLAAVGKACSLLDAAAVKPPGPARIRKLLKAGRKWRAAGRLLSKRAAKRVLTPECVTALAADYTDAANRVSLVLQGEAALP